MILFLNTLPQDISDTISSFKLKYCNVSQMKPNQPQNVFDSFESICKYQEDGLIDTTTTRRYQTWHQNEYLEKVNNLFNTFISRQCIPTFNKNTVSLRSNFEIRKKLSSLDFCLDDIAKIIGSLDQSKAHDHDEVSTSIIKLCASLISKLLYLIFKNYFFLFSSSNWVIFCKKWKKANMIPVDKKRNTQLITNY